MEQDEKMDISVAIEPDRFDVEQLILSELRPGPKKPKELTKIYKTRLEVAL